MPIYIYKCFDCDKASERFLKMAERENPGFCDCGGKLRRVITPPVVIFDGADLAYPTAAGKWEKDRLRTMAREQKNLKEHGDYYPNPRHW